MLLQHQYPTGGVYTSHYGPRQGIYQPMESFRSSNWRSQYFVLSQVYQNKANKRIKLPPNSFPARSLTKRPPISSYTFLPLSDTPPPRIKTPAHKEDSSDSPRGISPILVKPRPPISSYTFRPLSDTPPPRIKTSAHKKDSSHTDSPRGISPVLVKPHYLSHKSSVKSYPGPQSQTRHNPPSLTSVTVEMHPHPTARSTPQLPQQKGSSAKIFPFLDPLRTHDQDKRFTSRLVEFAKLECETVKQEALGRWVYQAPPTNGSPVSVPSTISSTILHPNAPKVGVTRVGSSRRIPREARSKSAKTKAEVESEAKHRTRHRHRHKSSTIVKVARGISQAQREICPTATKTTQSLHDLQTVSPSEADLQCLSLGSLSLVSVEEKKGSTEAVTSKRRECFLSASSCNLKACKTSLNRRCHSKITKNKESKSKT